MTKLTIDIHKRYQLRSKTRYRMYRVLRKYFRLFAWLIPVVIAAQQLMHILLYGSFLGNEPAVALKMLAFAAAFILADGLLVWHFRLQTGRFTLADEGTELRISRDEILYSCMLGKKKLLKVTLPKRDLIAVQQDKKRSYLLHFQRRFGVETLTAEGKVQAKRPLKKFALYDIYDQDLTKELLLAEYIG